MTYVIFSDIDLLNKKLIFLSSILIVLLFTSSFGIMVWWFTREPIDLGYEEIREYEGKDLSSIRNFRPNSIKGPQYIDNETYMLTVKGLVDDEKKLGYNEIISDYQSYKKVVTLNCVEGWRVTILWEGVLVKDLLSGSHVSPFANTVIFTAYDGYTTSLPLQYILDNNILLAYKMNNVTLPPERGYPFQLVAESKWGYKWIKWITTIELSDNPDYKGFWESRGYSNDADL
jgi:DMSO/TMAO reductase YedYZ molybdopterin-dependent catalytic subunit